MKQIQSKFALLSMLIFTFVSSAVFAQAWPQMGFDLQGLRPDNIAFGSRFELGDWSSSGDLSPEYEPSYKFSYICQLQLTNGLEYNSSGMPVKKSYAAESETYSLYAITNVRFDNKSSFIETDGLKWKTMKYYNNDKILNTKESAEVELNGHHVGLRFDAATEVQNDVVVLYTRVSQPIKGLLVSASAVSRASRKSQEFEGSVYANISAGDESQITPSYMLRAVCSREK